MKKIKLLPLILALVLLICCNKNDENKESPNNGGTLGDIGNTWSAKFDGNHDIAAKIISNTDGLLALEVNIESETDTIYLHFDGNTVSEFIHSNGDLTKPFTMVKFDCKVGDVYTFNLGDLYFHREVIEKETYYNHALEKEIPTIGVYEEIPYGVDLQIFGVYIQSIIWYWHPTYGLVCVDVYTSDGELIEITFVHIELK